MALQNYSERVVYPSLSIVASPLQIGQLVMQMDVELDMDRKTILDEGPVVYRSGNNYRIIGSSEEIVCDSKFDEDVPLDLSMMISRASNLNLFMTLDFPN